MSVVPKLFAGSIAKDRSKDLRKNAVLPRQIIRSPAKPTIFDIAAYFEPSAHFKFNRRVRNEFDQLSREYSRSTLLLGRYGGRPVMHTDIQGIGVATRVELGRLSIFPGRQHTLFENVLEMIAECQRQRVVSGDVERIVVTFPKADQRPREREDIRSAFDSIFSQSSCHFLVHEPHVIEIGHCVAYQTLMQHMREDGLYHSAHRERLEQVQRHLHQEVGRYENHKFLVSPRANQGNIPELIFCYTGVDADRRIEAFVEGYTGEKVRFVSGHEMDTDDHLYVGLKDYERASRRYGGLWILQGDIVSHLAAHHLGVLHLFFDDELCPEWSVLSWDELFNRMCESLYVDRASRTSPTFLEMALEILVKKGFIVDEPEFGFRLNTEIVDFMHASFYELGEFRKRGGLVPSLPS
tara:strand:- start:2736 stop:3962 length:1227 start_codon:yes stop_codon:yes gene_type:complete